MLFEDAQRVYVLACRVLEWGQTRPDFLRAHEADPTMTTDLWYERHCLPVSQMVHTAAASQGVACEVVCGLLVGPKHEGRYPRPWRHSWLEVPDGTIIDPTSAQYELPVCSVVRPEDELYRHYRMRGWWAEGDGEPAPFPIAF